MSQKAAQFRALHIPGDPLVLVNCWDPVSARVTVRAGVAAVATTSAGVSWALGAADGGRLGRDLALETIRRITTAVEVPVTADLEDGYGANAGEVGEVVAEAAAAGVVGVNIEDAQHHTGERLRPITDQVGRLAAARAAAPGVFLNARVDTFLTGGGTEEERITETVRRADAYLGAGADGVFVPGAADPDTIAALVGSIAAPVNVMVWPGALRVSQLAELGVARVSVGASAAHAAYDVVGRATRQVLLEGGYDLLTTSGRALDLDALMAPVA